MESTPSLAQPAAKHTEPQNPSGFFGRFENLGRKVWNAVAPGPYAWKGAAVGVLVVTAILWLLTSFYVTHGVTFSLVGTILFFVVGIIAGTIVGGFILLIGRLLGVLPSFYKWIALGAFFLIFLSFVSSSVPGILVVLVLIIVIASLTGAGLRVVLGKNITYEERTTASLTRRGAEQTFLVCPFF